jgi:pimeloyl-ACP methyl ester carboxylesterase
LRILALPGRLPETAPRIEALARALGGEVEVQRYAAWPGDPVPDEAAEAVRAAELRRPDLLIAMSFGTLVAMAAREAHGLSAKAYVFLGAPVRRLATEGRLDLFARQAAAAPTLFIQQTEDFTGPYRELLAALPPDAAAHEVPGGDHVYDDVAGLAAIITRWTGIPRRN